MINTIIGTFGLLAIIYLAICIFVYSQQNRITYPGATNDPLMLKSIEHQRLIVDSDSTELIVISRSINSESSRVLIYFGGNAEDITGMMYLCEDLDIGSFYSMNYRGYGSKKLADLPSYRSGGSASEQYLREDSEALIEYLLTKENIEPRNIILMGRSLGSAIAVNAADYLQKKSAHPASAGLILITPFTSMLDVAKSHYAWLPVQWLIKSPWHNRDKINNLSIPTLFVTAENDRVTPPNLGFDLYDYYSGPKQHLTIKDRGHNDLQLDNDYIHALNKFIRHLGSE